MVPLHSIGNRSTKRKQNDQLLKKKVKELCLLNKTNDLMRNVFLFDAKKSKLLLHWHHHFSTVTLAAPQNGVSRPNKIALISCYCYSGNKHDVNECSSMEFVFIYYS